MTGILLSSCAAALACCTLLPAAPIGKLRQKLRIRKLTDWQLMAAVTGLSAMSYGAASAISGGSPLMLALPAAALTALYASSILVKRRADWLRSEAARPYAPLEANSRLSQRSIWGLRILVSAAMAADVILMTFNGVSSPLALGAYLAAPLVGGLIAARFWKKSHAISDMMHQSELERFFGWADRAGVTAIVHLPDASKETLAQLDMLMAKLQAENIKAGIICRGRKTFGAVLKTYPTSWLVRTTHDLDHFAAAPIKQCFHLPVGTSAGHIVSLRKVRQILVDVNGKTIKGDSVPKELRMYDELWSYKAVSDALIQDAKDYGVEVLDHARKAAAPDLQVVVLPRVPKGSMSRLGVIIPQDDGTGSDLAYFGDVARALELEARDCDAPRFAICFEGGSKTPAAQEMLKSLKAAFGDEAIENMASPEATLNACADMVEGPWCRSYPEAAMGRQIVSCENQSICQSNRE